MILDLLAAPYSEFHPLSLQHHRLRQRVEAAHAITLHEPLRNLFYSYATNLVCSIPVSITASGTIIVITVSIITRDQHFFLTAVSLL